ncbi:hypothetical protein ACFRAR_28410 [Kitasatospora sp. NPDC056651]|uniref:hypothetical protein n=1 Tax=Kitasatospora sp. NPDC056651 TaxID=3345892 RepID=UPI0036917E70
MIFRVRAGNAALPLVSAYDVFEQTWSPPMPLLFQRRYGTEDRPLTHSYIRECLVATSQSAQITVAGDPLEWRPHDFRRIFVTDAIRSGLPPHIAAKICGRDYATPCQHENACVRCPLLRVDPAQMPRLQEIHANLVDRLQEAKNQSWLGEVAAIETTMAAATQKLEAMRERETQPSTVHLGMPDIRRDTGRSSADAETAFPTGPKLRR